MPTRNKFLALATPRRVVHYFWVTPENELAKRYLRYSHLFYRRILRVPKRLTPSPCSQHFKILCIGPVV